MRFQRLLSITRVSTVAVFFLTGLQAHGSIYDGGTYLSDKVKEDINIESFGPDLAPPSQQDQNLFAEAPLAKAFYVIGEDNKCYWGNFSKAKNTNALIIYYNSPVSNEHCIYQPSFSPKPSGYSISVKKGGRCVPAHVDVEGEKYDWVFSEDGPPVAFPFCFVDTTSYGDNIDHKHKHSSSIAAAESPKPQLQVIKSAPVILEVVPKSPPRRPASAEPLYTLQLASYLSMGEVNEAISKLKEKGVDAFVTTGKVAGTTRFRVCTGYFALAKTAREFQAELAEKSGIKVSFVQRLPHPGTNPSEQDGINDHK